MPDFSTQAVVLRSVDYGDSDKIVTLFTSGYGKISAIAKGAKRSMKRFGGTLELFSLVNVVWSRRRGTGFPFLKEATAIRPPDRIRRNIFKTAYASYWTELIDKWIEKGDRHYAIFELLSYVLGRLDDSEIDDSLLSMFFQVKFLALCGFSPNLQVCSVCHKPLDAFFGNRLYFSRIKGGVVCSGCGIHNNRDILLSRGTCKLLLWISNAPSDKALRIRFSGASKEEGTRLLEGFCVYCFNKDFKSLRFLREIRKEK
jgi:DNA repair protein RecO (recombination protein O)